jgi:hypothetical protein
LKKKNKNNNIGLKIGGVVIVLVLLIKWGNTFFQAKDTFTPQPKQQSQSNPKKQSKSTSNLPLLRCEFNNKDGSVHKELYDLEKINNNDPIKSMNDDEAKKYMNRKNAQFTTFNNNIDNQYIITIRNHDNGTEKIVHITIQRDTGEVELLIPKNIPVGADLGAVIESFADAQAFKGECFKVKRKNL